MGSITNHTLFCFVDTVLEVFRTVFYVKKGKSSFEVIHDKNEQFATKDKYMS